MDIDSKLGLVNVVKQLNQAILQGELTGFDSIQHIDPHLGGQSELFVESTTGGRWEVNPDMLGFFSKLNSG